MQMYAKRNVTSKYIFKNICFCCRLAYIFAYMNDEKEDKGVISVRPPEGSDLKEKLSKLADDTERSMNYHAVKAIEEYLKKNKVK